MATAKSKAKNRTESRRQEVRRQFSERRDTLRRRLLDNVHPGALLIWGGFYAVVLVILLSGAAKLPWHLNEPVERDILARVPFEIEDPLRTEQERQVAASQAPDVYVRNASLPILIRSRLSEALAIAKTVDGDVEALIKQLADKGWALDEEGASALLDYASEADKSAVFEQLVNRLLEELALGRLVNKPDPAVRSETPRTSILRPADPDEGNAIEVLTSQLRYVSDTRAVRQFADEITARVMPEPLREPVANLVASSILGTPATDTTAPTTPGTGELKPVWRYDAGATLEAIEQARTKVKPYRVHYERGAVVVRATPGTELSAAELGVLRREHEAYLEATRTDPILWRQRLLSQLGLAAILLLVTGGLCVYTLRYQHRILQKPARTFGLAALLTLVVLCSRLTLSVPEFSVGFVVMAAMLLTIAYNPRFAFGAVGMLSLLIVLATGRDFGLFLVLLASASTAVFGLREVRSRSKIIVVGLASALMALIASLTVGFYEGQNLKYVLEHTAAATGAAVFAGFLVQGILPHFEKLFGIATSMTLLEWCDAGRPLLRLLAQQAPGTYSHSLVLSQMCDDAAESIGANGLLARVGALYHDIGKITKPDYFVENQEARLSRHDRLSPTMSLLVITGHVKDGIELARAYGLPRVLHQFILEHHGTTVVRYFHHAASEAAARASTGRHDREVPESEFRYPGPKPRSRESAILMLADACEGAVRALDEPTAGRIESTVHQMVMARLSDGQFDDCEITLRELHLVERSIVKSLAAIHHGRIKYPKAKSATPAERTGEANASKSAGGDARGATEQPAVDAGHDNKLDQTAGTQSSSEVARSS